MTFSGTDGHLTRSEGSRPVIELRHLTKRYGPVLAVDDLSFTVAAGQVTGFLGPNGSGKSTTMRMIVGLDAPTAGQVTIAGRGYSQLRFPLREVGALLDASAVHPGRTARNHLAWLAATNEIPRGRVGAKVATFSAVVAVVGLASCFAAFWVCQALLAPKHAGLSISDPGVLRAVTGGALHLVLIGVIAVALGAAMRRTAGAVAVLFAVLLVVPGLVTLLPAPWNNDITRYLPNSAGAAMSAVARFPNLLSPAAGLIVLCAYAAATLILAALALTRRDA